MEKDSLHYRVTWLLLDTKQRIFHNYNYYAKIVKFNHVILYIFSNGLAFYVESIEIQNQYHISITKESSCLIYIRTAEKLIFDVQITEM